MDDQFQKIRLNDGGWIPSIGFGTGTTYFNRPDDVSEGLIKAVNAGFTLLDTAVMYGTEDGVGKGVVKVVKDGNCKREDLFITTKLAPTFLSYQETVAMVNDSLAKLQLQYIDLMMIHYPGVSTFYKEKEFPNDPKNNAEARIEMWEALQYCQKEGKLKHIGVSNFTKVHLESLISDPRCKTIPSVNQIEFNPYLVDKEILETCEKHKILVQSYGPIGSGPRKPQGEVEEGTNWNLLDDSILKSIASKHECTVAQVCMAYALKRGVGVVTKTEKEERMKENLDSTKIADKLTNEDIEAINQLNKNMRKFWNPYLIA